ncbi:hypothetical protein [Gimesia sp.]|uniref:hypothetical protein n=1 Tax=Gimesia sp. TaxID=2024833 RepID=UPI003A95BDB7
MQLFNSIQLAKMLSGLACTIAVIHGPFAVADEIPTTEELTVAYNEKYNATKIILIDTATISQSTLVDQEDLWRFYHIRPFIQSTKTLVYDQDGRFYQATRSHWDLIEQAVLKDIQSRFPGKSINALPFDVYQSAVDKELLRVSDQPMSAVITVFDGKKVWQHREAEVLTTNGIARKAYTILNPDSEQVDLLPETLLDYLLISPCTNDLPKDNEKRLKNCLPDMLASGNYSIFPQMQDISGHPCVLVESASQSIWLDPQFGYAVRRRVWRHHDSKTIYEIEADQFEVILPDLLWLPRSVLARQYGITDIAKGRYAGVPLFENITEIKKIEINQPKLEKYFSLEVNPGNWVNDTTLRALDSNGKEIAVPGDSNVSYIQPADHSDLEQVIQEARLESGQIPAKNVLTKGKGIWFSILIWFNVGFLVMILLFVGYRKFVSRA